MAAAGGAELSDRGEPASLHIQQLVELLAVVSGFSDEASAVEGAVERSAQALEAEVAAVVFGDRVAASIGFPAGAVPEAELVEVAYRRAGAVEVPGLGRCPAVAAAWDGTRPGILVLARWGDEGFSIEEQNLVRGMARLLELTLTMLRTLQAEHTTRQRFERQAAENKQLLDSLQERQRLLGHLFDIQRAIARRRPLQQILDTITTAARDLLGDGIVGLWLREDEAPDRVRLRSVVGLGVRSAQGLPAVPLAEAGVGGEAILGDEIIVRHGDPAVAPVIGRYAPGPVYASLAAPVHLSGAVTGALVIASCRPSQIYGSPHEETLRVFAEHVSLALTDAYTVHRMQVAFHDALTGLASRGLFLERLSERLAAAEREGSTVAMLFLDLDRFKEINDTLGHTIGDQVLMGTAERLKRVIRPDHDLAARFGGDEFAVMLPSVDGAGEALAVAERIVATLAEPMSAAQHKLRMAASVGVALSVPGQQSPDTADLIRRADVAMYQAKRNGRGRAELYVETMQQAFG